MTNRKDDLKGLLTRALQSTQGIILKLTGSEPGQRQSAIAALTAAKRELLPDIPEMLDLQVRAIPGREDEIAIIKLAKEIPE